MNHNISNNSKYPCGVCGKCASTAAIFCNTCKKWNHFKCVNLLYSKAKNLSQEERKLWKCLNCKQCDKENNEQLYLYNENAEENSNLEDSLTLAAEIGKALLQENEELKQALHESSNAKSAYELELEDRIQEKAEEIKIILEKQKKKEEELNLTVQTLKNKLENEKKQNLELILQANNKEISHNEKSKDMFCRKCEIYKDETKNMISSIKSLEVVAEELQNENLNLRNKLKRNSEFQCLQCFPPLSFNTRTLKKKNVNHEYWQKVPRKQSVPPRNLTIGVNSIETKNRFTIPSDEWRNEEEEEGADGTIEMEKLEEEENNQKNSNKLNSRKYKLQQKTDHKSQHREHPRTLIKQKNKIHGVPAVKSDILILADSHGRDLSSMIQSRTTATVTAHVRPGAKFSGVVGDMLELSASSTKKDYVVIIAGSNNIESDNVEKLTDDLSLVLKNLKYTNVIVATLPMRHDKPELDSKIERINKNFRNLISAETNVEVLELYDLPRHLYTRHGLHFNRLGKNIISLKCINLLKQLQSVNKLDLRQNVTPDTPSPIPPQPDIQSEQPYLSPPLEFEGPLPIRYSQVDLSNNVIAVSYTSTLNLVANQNTEVK